MKRILTISLLLVGLAGMARGQSLISCKTGAYTSADGNYTISVELKEGSLHLTEPNRSTVYASVGNNLYSYTHPNGTIYQIRVKSESVIESGKQGSSSWYPFTFNENAFNAQPSDEINEAYVAVYEKYLEKMQSGDGEVQIWAFCGAAALARSQYNDEGFKEYVKALILSAKQIMVTPDECPCTDAIPAELWNSVK